jgi:hypothetical protein
MNRLSKKTKFVLAGFLILIVIPLALIQGFHEWLHSGGLRASLDPRYVATAQYLFENPNPTPERMGIAPSPGEIIRAGDRVCVYVYNEKSFLFPQFLINKKRLSIDDIKISAGGTFDHENISFCFTNEPSSNLGLDEGIHLFEIRLRKNIFDKQIRYEWAVRVEN